MTAAGLTIIREDFQSPKHGAATLVFAAVLAWHLGGLPANTAGLMRGPAWALAICFAVVTILIWRYFFMAPLIFSATISLCLIAAAWLSSKTS